MNIRERLERLTYVTKSFSLCFSWVIGSGEWCQPLSGEFCSLTTPCLTLTELITSYTNIYFCCCQYDAMCHHFPEQPEVFSLTPHFFKPDHQTVGEPWQMCISLKKRHVSNSCARKHVPLKGLTVLGPSAESLWGILVPPLSFHQYKQKSSFKF